MLGLSLYYYQYDRYISRAKQVLSADILYIDVFDYQAEYVQRITDDNADGIADYLVSIMHSSAPSIYEDEQVEMPWMMVLTFSTSEGSCQIKVYEHFIHIEPLTDMREYGAEGIAHRIVEIADFDPPALEQLQDAYY